MRPTIATMRTDPGPTRVLRRNELYAAAAAEYGAAAIAEVTGLAPGNVATKIHRIKTILARQFQTGGAHGA